jgi:hypothetical protein
LVSQDRVGTRPDGVGTTWQTGPEHGGFRGERGQWRDRVIQHPGRRSDL